MEFLKRDSKCHEVNGQPCLAFVLKLTARELGKKP